MFGALFTKTRHLIPTTHNISVRRALSRSLFNLTILWLFRRFRRRRRRWRRPASRRRRRRPRRKGRAWLRRLLMVGHLLVRRRATLVHAVWRRTSAWREAWLMLLPPRRVALLRHHLRRRLLLLPRLLLRTLPWLLLRRRATPCLLLLLLAGHHLAWLRRPAFVALVAPRPVPVLTVGARPVADGRIDAFWRRGQLLLLWRHSHHGLRKMGLALEAGRPRGEVDLTAHSALPVAIHTLNRPPRA